jgi:ribonuclease J
VKEKRLRTIPLGGLGEVGKNMWVVEYGDDIVVIDCGLMFPDDHMHGIDLVIPDVTYLIENRDRVRGIIITHGHEDHVGALPYVLPQINVPVYATRLAHGLISVKLKEHRLLHSTEQVVMNPGECVDLGELTVEFIQVGHSIPDAVMVAVHSPGGTMVHTGDFKFDQNPWDGRITDFGRLAELGGDGVLVLVSDCVRVEQPGFSPSERLVAETFDRIFSSVKGRVLITTFASNLSRVQQAINAAHRHGRKSAVVGRSIERNVAVARELGYLAIPEGSLVRLEELNKLPQEEALLITTGSQGEPTSALSRIASREHRQIQVGPGDTVILSASPVPGNEHAVSRTINNLFRLGADVIYGPEAGVHVSGHASREELRLMINLLKPQFVIPGHGEYRHMVLYKRLAEECGVPGPNILMPELGSVIEFAHGYSKIVDTVTAGDVLVDGTTVGEVGEVVLRDRRLLAKDGVLIIIVTIDRQTGRLVDRPQVVSRGFVQVPDAEELLDAAKGRAEKAIEMCASAEAEPGFMESEIREAVGKYLYQQTRRRPMILPVIQRL